MATNYRTSRRGGNSGFFSFAGSSSRLPLHTFFRQDDHFQSDGSVLPRSQYPSRLIFANGGLSLLAATCYDARRSPETIGKRKLPRAIKVRQSCSGRKMTSLTIRILVPIDFSEHSKKTVSYATRTASRHQSTIYLLHVFQIPDYVVTPYARRRQNSAEVHSQLGSRGARGEGNP